MKASRRSFIEDHYNNTAGVGVQQYTTREQMTERPGRVRGKGGAGGGDTVRTLQEESPSTSSDAAALTQRLAATLSTPDTVQPAEITLQQPPRSSRASRGSQNAMAFLEGQSDVAPRRGSQAHAVKLPRASLLPTPEESTMITEEAQRPTATPEKEVASPKSSDTTLKAVPVIKAAAHTGVDTTEVDRDFSFEDIHPAIRASASKNDGGVDTPSNDVGTTGLNKPVVTVLQDQHGRRRSQVQV